MGMIDERDDDQSFSDWFIHGSRKKAEKKKIEKEQKKQMTQSELDIQKQIEEQIKAQDASQKPITQQPITQQSAVSKPVQQVQVATQSPTIQQPASLQPIVQQAKPVAQVKKDEKKIVLQRPSKYPKFILSRPKLNAISNDAKEATYPLISPYAYAEIKDDGGMLYYKVIEPVIDDDEKKALEKLKTALIHFIDIPMSSVKEEKELLEFLEEKVQWLLEETDIYVDEKSYTKIMYYLYRDFIGLNSLEPLLRDPYIEDLACDGTGVNIYAIHQKFGTLRTNVTFENEDELREFVVKLSQRCNRYISYAEPMLDGSLQDGTRINATLARDVTSRGPTFSIRKFRDKPFSPIEMIGFHTVDPDILAYLWIVIENGSNVLLCGGTGTGKTSLLNSICMFMPEEMKVVSIEDSVTGDSKLIIRENGKIRNISIKEFVDNKIVAEVLTLDEKGNVVFVKPSKYIKHKTKKDIYEVLTATGRKLKVTQDHSLFTLGDRGLVDIKPTELEEKKSYIAVPRSLPITGKEVNEINLIDYLDFFKEDFLCGSPISKVFEKYSFSELNMKKERYKWSKIHNLIKIEDFIKLNEIFTHEELKDLRIKSKNKASIPVIFDVSKEFLEFCGLWLGDGSYDNYNKNVVIISNVDGECRDVFKKICNYLGSNYSIMTDKGVSLRLHSTVFYKFMKNVLKLDGYSSTKKIPEFIFGLSNDQIKHFIRGYFSADGTVKKYEVSCSSQSYELLEDLQTMFLRFGIISRINDFDRKDKCINMSISTLENIDKFKDIGFLQARKNEKLKLLKRATHTNSDIIPLSLQQMISLGQLSGKKIPWAYTQGHQRLGREHIQRIAPEGCEFNDLSHNDIFWDKVKSIKKVSSDEIEVFDLSIPKYEKFLCNNIFVHNTREIRLNHENWLPAVARMGFGGTKTGEVTMFDLLKESFRQNPNYIIVGEVRGEEAAVMFQAMASGMTAMSTMHAGSADDALKRLQTRPISLPPTLMETLDLMIVMTHAYEKGPSARRIKEIAEIQDVDANTSKVNINRVFAWDPVNDKYFHNEAKLLKEIAMKKGYSENYMAQEFENRKKIIEWLSNKQLDWKTVTDYFTEYRRNKEKVMKIISGQLPELGSKEESNEEKQEIKLETKSEEQKTPNVQELIDQSKKNLAKVENKTEQLTPQKIL